MTEHDLQASIIAECDLRANQNPLYGRIFAVPNGGHRNKATAGKLKAEGVRAGVPDLLLLYPRHGYHGLVIELKVGNNSATRQQTEWMAWLKAQGYFTVIVREAQTAMDVLCWYIEEELL